MLRIKYLTLIISICILLSDCEKESNIINSSINDYDSIFFEDNYFYNLSLQSINDTHNMILSPWGIYDYLYKLNNFAIDNTKNEIEEILDINDIPSTTNIVIKNNTWIDSSLVNEVSKLDDFNINLNVLNSNLAKNQINYWITDISNNRITSIIDNKLSKDINLIGFNYVNLSLNLNYNDIEFFDFRGTNYSKEVEYYIKYCENIKYFISDDYEGIELESDKYLYQLFIPKNDDSLVSLLKNLKYNDIKYENKDVLLKIPNINYQKVFSTKEILNKIGLLDLFNLKNCKLNLNDSLFLYDLIQISDIQIFDNLSTNTPNQKSLEFICNEPFIFIIRDKYSNLIYNIGAINNL